MISCDLNCDMGEGAGNDVHIMPYISSANIACGFHAGDEESMRTTVLLAKQFGVAIGAHPSFPDRENFGRTELSNYHQEEVYEWIKEQVLLLKKITEEEGATLHHVKPHGALYNMAARDEALAATVARAVYDIDSSLVLYGLSGSYLLSEAKKLGMSTGSEVFADRSYEVDGSLTPRSRAGALIEDEEASLSQVLEMIVEGRVVTVSRSSIPIVADTVCIHGDGKNAAAFAKTIYEGLRARSIIIKTL